MDLNFINDCGITANTVKQRVKDCVRDGQETFTPHESLEVIGRVVELARTLARQKENRVANELEIEMDHVLHLRKRFGQMTHSGVIGQQEVRHIIEDMHPDVAIDDAALRHVLEEALRGEFYDIMDKVKRSNNMNNLPGPAVSYESKTTSKPAEPSKGGTTAKGENQKEAAKAIAEEEAAMLKKVLENIVLCFDAYLRVVVHLVAGAKSQHANAS